MDSKPPSLDALRIDRSQAPLKSGGGSAWWIALILLLAGGAGAWWMLREKPISVKTATVQMRSAQSGGSGRTLLNASGYVTTRLDATVSSKITGKVAEILIEEGMKVEKNQVLAKLDPSNVESGLRLATAQLESVRRSLAETEPMVEYTEAEMRRVNGLSGTRAVSNSDVGKAVADAGAQRARLERLKADVIVAERQVDDWKQQLDDTIIRAPFAGVVTTKDSQPGEMISPMSSGGFTRTGICTLVDMASLEIEVDVGESFINRVKAGQPVIAKLDAYQDWEIPCKVTAIIPTADRQKATVKVRVAFETLDPRILPQMGVKVAFQSDPSTEPVATGDVLSIPKEAIQKDGGRNIAWVVRDGKVERRAVAIANTSGSEVTLSAGLSSGENVILNPPEKLTDGTTVTVEPSR